MNGNKLVRMANQIASFFEAMPDRTDAIDGLVHHIRASWEPRMRQGLQHHIQCCGDSELRPLVREALPRILADG